MTVWQVLGVIWVLAAVLVGIYLGLYIGYLIFMDEGQKFIDFVKDTFKREK